MRPGVHAEPRPQERVLRHTVEHIVDLVRVAPMVQILDAPVPQMGEQLPDILHFFSTFTPDPEQVIEVPKILLDDVPMRAAVRDTQLGEQLVEVPTIVSYSWLQLRVEQNVDIPVPGRRGRISGLPGCRAGQNSTAYLEQIVEIPVPQDRREGGLQGSLPVQNSAAVVEQIVEIPTLGGLQGFLPGQGSSSSSRLLPDEDEGFQWGFSHFSPAWTCRGGGGDSLDLTGGLRRRWRCCSDWRRGCGECMQPGAPQLHRSGVGTGDGLGAAGGGCLL